jgi:hypothetical protein
MSRTPAERWTLAVAGAMALSLVICTALWALDPRVLDNGDSVWLKPIRFSLAFTVHLLTLVWLARLTLSGRGAGVALHRAFSVGLWLQVAAALVEWVCIVLQGARGVHSHFNYATFFDHAVFTVMGWGTAVLAAGIVLCGWGIARSRAEPVVKRLLLGATTLALLGAAAGVLMVMPTAEQRALLEQGERLAWIGGTVVGTASGRVLPFFHWDLAAGDWRAVHFVGLHALQALPLLAWLSLRAAPPRRANAQRWATIGGWAYALFFAALVGWTLFGRSMFAVTAPGWWWLATPGILFALAALACLMTPGQRRVA